jgi:hypothetical protein
MAPLSVLAFDVRPRKGIIKADLVCYAVRALFFDNRATAKCVAHHPVNSSDEHRR